MYIHDNGKIIDEIIEHDNNSVMSTTNMAYGTNCPVIIDSKYDGIVLLPERSCSTTTTLEEGGGKGGTKTFHYTVMIYMTGGQSRYEFGVEAHRIKYRKVVPTTTVAIVGEELLVLQDADAIVATPNHATVANGAVQPTIIVGQAKEKKTVVPSSITVEADNNNKRKCDDMDESSPLTITPPMMRDSSYHNNVAAAHSNAIVARSIEEDLHKHETNCSNVSSEGVNDNKIVMTLPEWIQHNQHRQQDLFCEFIKRRSSTDFPTFVFFIVYLTFLLSLSSIYCQSILLGQNTIKKEKLQCKILHMKQNAK